MIGKVLRLPGVESLLLPPGSTLDIRLAPAGTSHPLQQAIDARWNDLRAANARYHDGEILAVSAWTGTAITCRRASFRELAARPQVATDCELLAVTAVVTARDRGGVVRVLLGKRHRQTRIYGGLWELGPSGGVPPTEGAHLDEAALLRQLGAELDEEAGLSIRDAWVTLCGIIRDLTAFSLDIVYRVDMQIPLEDVKLGKRDWEYEEIRWMTIDEARTEATQHPAGFIPPTHIMLARQEWLLFDRTSGT